MLDTNRQKLNKIKSDTKIWRICIFPIPLHSQTRKILRGGAVVARWAHNPKVVGSSPASATKKASEYLGCLYFFRYGNTKCRIKAGEKDRRIS